MPWGGQVGANVASSATAGSALSRPRQLGPTMRIPAARTLASIASWIARPASPVSAKPAVMINTAFTPVATQSSITAGTCAAGTTITASSIASGTARRSGYARTPCTELAPGLIGYTAPVKPLAIRLWKISAPIVPRVREAPITATVLGFSNESSECAIA